MDVTSWLASVQNHLALIFIALLLTMLLGGTRAMRRKLGLSQWRNAYQRLFHRLELKLNRTRRSRKARAARGLMLLILSMLVALAAARIVLALETLHPKAWLIEAVILAFFLPIRSLWEDSRAVYTLILAKNLNGARKRLRPLLWRDSSVLDLHGAARAAIESLSVHFTARILSPLFWYLLFGLPAFLVCRQVTLLARLFAHPLPRYEAFGWFIAQFNRYLHAIPARLATLILVAAALFVPHGHPVKALAAAFTPPTGRAAFYSRTVIATVAGALNLSLGGPHSHHGHFIDAPWIGKGTAKATARDLRYAMLLYGIAILLVLLLVAIAMLI